MSTWDAMTPSEYADCIDAGRGPVRDVRDEADQLRKETRESGKYQDLGRQLTTDQYEAMSLRDVIALGVEDGKLGHLRINGIMDMNAVRQRMYAKGYAEGKANR